MRIEQLFYFIEVAKTRSIRLAAEKNHISQQSLSESLRNLEQYFGVVLLERSYRGVSLTEAGNKVLDLAIDIIDSVDDINREFDQYTHDETNALTGDLKVSINPFLCKYSLFNDALNQYQKKFPNVNITLNENTLPKILPDIINNKIDIGIINFMNSVYYPDDILKLFIELEYKPLIEDKLVAFVGTKSPLANRKTISMEELLKYNRCVYQQDFKDKPLYANFHGLFGKPEKLLIFNTTVIYWETISKGNGVGIACSSCLNNNNLAKQELTILSLKEHIPISCGLLTSRNTEMSDTTTEFVKIYLSTIAQN